MSDFGRQKGSWAAAPTTGPKSSGKPSAGITNDAKDYCVCPANDKGVGANGKRIK